MCVICVRDCEFDHACTKGCHMWCNHVTDMVAGTLVWNETPALARAASDQISDSKITRIPCRAASKLHPSASIATRCTHFVYYIHAALLYQVPTPFKTPKYPPQPDVIPYISKPIVNSHRITTSAYQRQLNHPNTQHRPKLYPT